MGPGETPKCLIVSGNAGSVCCFDYSPGPVPILIQTSSHSVIAYNLMNPQTNVCLVEDIMS